MTAVSIFTDPKSSPINTTLGALEIQGSLKKKITKVREAMRKIISKT
jgi:hypothetical protein